MRAGENRLSQGCLIKVTTLIHICSCQLQEHSAERTLNVTIQANTEMCVDRFKAKSRDEKKKTVKTAREKMVC